MPEANMHRWPAQPACTLALDGDLLVDVEAPEGVGHLRLVGVPGYSDMPPSEDFEAPPMTYETDEKIGTVQWELETHADGLVTLAMTVRLENPTDAAFTTAIEAYRDMYESWELTLLPEPPGEPTGAGLDVDKDPFAFFAFGKV